METHSRQGKRFRLWIGLAASLLLLLWISALQAAGDVTVQVTQHPTYGRILTDGKGRSLYLFTGDGKNTSTCYGECAQNWPPLLVSDKPRAGQGVAANLLGTTQRRDGTLQVTYNGWPLYYHAKDEKPGDAYGQGAGGTWFLVSPYGVAVRPPEAQQRAPAAPRNADATVPAELMEQGRSVFAANCSVCHGDRGQGGAGPALAANKKLADADFVARQIMLGSRFMPRFDNRFSDKEVAAVATFIRNSWGNNYGVVTEEQVKKYR